MGRAEGQGREMRYNNNFSAQRFGYRSCEENNSTNEIEHICRGREKPRSAVVGCRRKQYWHTRMVLTCRTALGTELKHPVDAGFGGPGRTITVGRRAIRPSMYPLLERRIRNTSGEESERTGREEERALEEINSSRRFSACEGA